MNQDQTTPMPAPTDVTIGLWGPPEGATLTETGWKRRKPRRPWGLGDVAYGFLGLVLSQILLLPVVALMAISRLGEDVLNDPAAVDLILDEITEVITTGPFLVTAMLLQWAAFVGAPVYASYRKGHKSLALDFGLRFRKSDLWLGFVIAWGLQVVLFGFVNLVTALGVDLSGSDNTSIVTDHAGWLLVFMVLAAAVGAPLTEELFFRGLILRAFLRRFAKVDHAPPIAGVTDKIRAEVVSVRRRKIGVVASVLVSSFLFGIMHTPVSDGTTEIPLSASIALASQTGFLGLVFAVIAVKTRRIGLVVAAHLVFNSTSIALVLLTR